MIKLHGGHARRRRDSTKKVKRRVGRVISPTRLVAILIRLLFEQHTDRETEEFVNTVGHDFEKYIGNQRIW